MSVQVIHTDEASTANDARHHLSVLYRAGDLVLSCTPWEVRPLSDYVESGFRVQRYAIYYVPARAR